MKIKKSLVKELAKPVKAKQVWVMDKSGHKRGFFGWYQVHSARIIPMVGKSKEEYLLLEIDIPETRV